MSMDQRQIDEMGMSCDVCKKLTLQRFEVECMKSALGSWCVSQVESPFGARCKLLVS